MPRKVQVDDEKLKTLFAQHMSIKEIGEKLGISYPTVRARLINLGLMKEKVRAQKAEPKRRDLDLEITDFIDAIQTELIALEQDIKEATDKKAKLERKLKALKHALILDDEPKKKTAN